MKLCRISHESLVAARYAVLSGSSVFPLPADYNFGKISDTERVLALDEVKLLAPVAPSKIVCVGRNYREHAAELGNKMPDEPLLFLKAPSAVVGLDEQIEIPSASQQVEHEGELGVVIGRTARNIPQHEDPLSYVFGYTCVNDVTARDLQRKDVQFTRGKSFDTFCPVGPWIETEIDPNSVAVETRLNGEVKQKGNTADMAFPVAFLIRYISEIMTLCPGDLIATGTPAGVSRMKHGDTVEVEVAGIGVLRNQVH
ncbi:MAG TPA: fumarylacetoacetate hydrolase family protein [Pyrinomonadaceae bacterium]|nr:fumarylacetoacetate hydrolase family protein [Pyrinomonadaceae bacterium]